MADVGATSVARVGNNNSLLSTDVFTRPPSSMSSCMLPDFSTNSPGPTEIPTLESSLITSKTTGKATLLRIQHHKLRPLESLTITNLSCTTALTISPRTARKLLYDWTEAMLPLETTMAFLRSI